MDSSDLLNEIMHGNIHDDDTLLTKVVHPWSRGSCFHYKRINMQYYMVMCCETDGFKCHHHMIEQSYHRLVCISTPVFSLIIRNQVIIRQIMMLLPLK